MWDLYVSWKLRMLYFQSFFSMFPTYLHKKLLLALNNPGMAMPHFSAFWSTE